MFLHTIPDPELIVRAAGTRLAIESSYQHERGLSTDFGSARQQHQLRADPNDVRRLREGMCYVVGSGRAQKVQITPAPSATVPALGSVLSATARRDDGEGDACDEPVRL